MESHVAERGKMGRQAGRAGLFVCTVGIQLLAAWQRRRSGAGDAFSRAGSGVGGDDAIGRTRWWTVGVKRSVLVVHEPSSSRQRDSCIRKRNTQAAYIIDLSAI